MLKERVRAYCGTEENCACIILCAVAEEYEITLSEDILSACGGISGGFGIGGLCGGLVAAVMALGMFFDEKEVKAKRLLFLFQVQAKLGCLDCCRLSVLGQDCTAVLEEIAAILQEVIEG